ncbi:hypothetical protein LZF95_14505 [Algoriphagus sp. AGSA1]|uniref:DUF6973 domain-containing protein n=1 Tax=Algoriphagus sp. AGSA1 TaxID=2907213 RepID=UPI001F39DE90|nr:hypothetical protein [Algoriphagus sp. AGSA1]MCE7055889.1 hypothetical protein [Algoriphagus sp. AGSA1]
MPYILKVIPKDSNVQFDTEDFYQGGYQNIPSDFTGSYEFYTWNEKLIGGWGIKDGKKVTRIKPEKKVNAKSSARISDVYCYQIVTNWYSVACSGDYCGQPTLIDQTSYTHCTYYAAPPSMEGDGHPIGGNPGGGDPNEEEPCEFPEGNLFDVPISCEEDEMTAEDIIDFITSRFGVTLKNCEKKLIRSDPSYWPDAINVFLNKESAENKTRSIFGINGRNDCSDAFRHAYWNALNTKRIGIASAALFGTAHECQRPTANLETAMDYYNNDVGRTIALNNPNASDNLLADYVLQSLHNGELKIISHLDSNGLATSNSDTINSSSCQ